MFNIPDSKLVNKICGALVSLARHHTTLYPVFYIFMVCQDTAFRPFGFPVI